jgi:TctA family transporter
MIGLFGISEVLRLSLSLHHPPDELSPTLPQNNSVTLSFMRVFPAIWKRKWHTMRSSLIGSLVGMLPGAGADIAAWISYAVSKRLSRRPSQYGHGSLEGIADASGANNAALGGAWIPALVFGIPGDSVTAIAIGVLLMKNITPGPNIFDATENAHQASLVVSIYVTFVIASLMLIPFGVAAIRVGAYLIQIPRTILLPLIVLFCIVGSYSMASSYFDVWIMLFTGLLGFGLERFKFPLGPVVLGLILGGQVEHRFLQSLTKSTDVSAFFASPISAVLGLCCMCLWIAPLLIPRQAADEPK